MSGLFNGIFGDPQQQTLQAQQSAQGNAQQFQMKMFQQMLQQQQQAKQQAMQSLQQYLSANPNPATQWGGIAGPQNTAPATMGGGTLGANGMPQGGSLPNQMPQGNPNAVALLAALLHPQGASNNPGANLGIPTAATPGAPPPAGAVPKTPPMFPPNARMPLRPGLM